MGSRVFLSEIQNICQNGPFDKNILNLNSKKAAQIARAVLAALHPPQERKINSNPARVKFF
jgi:hypothetical protein